MNINRIFYYKKNIEFSRVQKCNSCHGNRSSIGSRPSKCYVCKNKVSNKCTKCKGTGYIIKNPCKYNYININIEFNKLKYL